jgi:DNA-binding PadR family transcriptional regulator
MFEGWVTCETQNGSYGHPDDYYRLTPKGIEQAKKMLAISEG